MSKFIFLIFLILSLQANASPADSVKQIHNLMSTLYEQGEFNGSILVAARGKVIYSNGFGFANFKTEEKFTTNTVSCIASVTKQFTALGIMMVAEQNKLKYNDPVSKHIQKLPDHYSQITIRHMLTHTSGIYDYEDLGSGRPDKLIMKNNSFRFPPGQKYEYSNSNYVLLSIIIERLSGMSFDNFLQKKIFDPLAMRNTFTSVHSSQKAKGVAIGFNQFGKQNDYDSHAFFGDGGIYSTVEDLFKWDQALYTEKLVKQSALSEAFTPGQVKEGKSTYGFGWNISEDDHGKYLWHTGNTSGFRAYIQRRISEQITIIILTNTGHSRRIEIAEAIIDILAARSYSLPKMSAAKKMYTMINKSGIDPAMRFYDSLKRHKSGSGYDFAESEFNLLGYELLGDNKVDEAIEIFRLNTEAYPASSNTFDSLGEAYLKKGDKKSAYASFQKALEIDPTNLHASDMLKKIK